MNEIFDSIVSTIFGKNGSVTETDITNLAERQKLSDFLPYLYYNEEHQAFLNTDNTYGYCYECFPSNFYSPKQCSRMQKLLENKFPPRTVISVSLYADPHVKPMLDAYVAAKSRTSVLARKSATEYANHLLRGTKHFRQTNIPIRNFIVLISIKSPELLRDDQLSAVEESLKAVGIFANKMNGSDLAVFLRRFLNGKENQEVSDTISLTKPIRKQVIEANSHMSFPINGFARIGPRYAACLTQLTCPETTSLLNENKLTGGYMGVEDDGNQILTPFMSTYVITFDDVESEIASKSKVMLGQHVVGKAAIELGKRIDEIRWISSLSETKKAKVQHILWIYADSEEQLSESVSRAKRLYTDQDYILQEETLLKSTLFIASLPFGFYHVKGNVELIDRYTILPAESIAAVLPLQADYSGSYRIINGKVPEGQRPVVIQVGRKGQIQAYDVFDERSNNHNLLITAGSGAGKSFKLGKLINDYYSVGAKVRAVDIGYSLQKSCSMNKGRFIDLGTDNVILNPFDAYSTGDQDDIDGNFNNTVNVLAEMVYSSSGKVMSETENTLLKLAARYTIQKGNHEKGIDCVQHYLNNFVQIEKDNPLVSPILSVETVVNTAKEMGFNISDFNSHGTYGRYFNGKSTFDISKDDFVILELQQLKEVKELFAVMTMQVVNAVTQDLYLSNRKDQRFVLFEEAAHYLKSQGHKDLGRLAAIIEEGYRRARKHNGSFGAVLQSILDLNFFGAIGKVLKSNAEYKFFLFSEDYAEAAREGLIGHKGLSLELLESIKNNKPRYSEFMAENPRSRGCGRLAIDPWNYWVNTSSGREVNEYNDLVAQGLLPEQAISRLSGIPL